MAAWVMMLPAEFVAAVVVVVVEKKSEEDDDEEALPSPETHPKTKPSGCELAKDADDPPIDKYPELDSQSQLETAAVSTIEDMVDVQVDEKQSKRLRKAPFDGLNVMEALSS